MIDFLFPEGRIPPAGLVFFTGWEKPRQYVIFEEVTFHGQNETEVCTPRSLLLTCPFLCKDQARIFLKNDTWYFCSLTDDVPAHVGKLCVKEGEEIPLQDSTVIRLGGREALTVVFYSRYAGGQDWEFIPMDPGQHVIHIRSHEESFPSDELTLQFKKGKWEIKGLSSASSAHGKGGAGGGRGLHPNESLRIGSSRLVLVESGLLYGYPVQTMGLSIKIDERSVHRFLKKIMLLRDICLSITPGSMVLVLGGSGAGKSTFVNAVTGYEKAKASIQEGGLDYYKDFEQVKHRIGYVPQENLLRDEESVKKALENAACIRLPRETSPEDREKKIEATLETFGLTGKEKELISKLSGGERKRLSIATEFVGSPEVFILDEPDSGLDGSMARELMENLLLIACQGRIVLVITHSPDRVAHLFDKVIVLARDSENKVGQLAFYGGIEEAREFFGVSTMEGIVRLLNAGNEGGEGRADEFIERYRQQDAFREQPHKDPPVRPPVVSPADPSAGKSAGTSAGTAAGKSAAASAGTAAGKSAAASAGPSAGKSIRYKNRLEQIPLYLRREFRLMVNERNWKMPVMTAIISYVVIYVLGRGMFRNMEYTKYGSLALISIGIWNGMFNSIQRICKERKIIKREHRSGMYITSFMAAQMLFQAFLCLVQVAIELAVFRIFGMYFPDTGLISGSFGTDLFITMFLITFAADMMALMVSCIVHSTTVAMTVMPFLLLVQLVFSGPVFPLNKAGAKWVSEYSISSWGIRAINIAADYNGQKSSLLYRSLNGLHIPANSVAGSFQEFLETPAVREKVEEYTSSWLYMKDFAYTKENLLGCWQHLLVFSLIYLLAGVIFLEFIDEEKR